MPVREESDLTVAWQELGIRSKPNGLVYLPLSLGMVCLTPELAQIPWLVPLTILLFSLASWWRYDSSRKLAQASGSDLYIAKRNFDWSARTAALLLGVLAAVTISLAQDWQLWLALMIAAVMIAAATFSMACDFRLFFQFSACMAYPSVLALLAQNTEQGLVIGVTTFTFVALGIFVGWFNYRNYWDLLLKNRRQSDELKHLRDQMEQSEKLKTLGVLAGGVAHDFNNLLMAILGNLEIAESELVERGGKSESLKLAKTAVMDAARLSDQLLAYAGKGQFSLERICINELIQSMSQLLRASIGKDLVLELDLDSELPKVLGDAGQLREVVLNLLNNASEAMEKKVHGTIKLSTKSIVLSAEEAEKYLLPPGVYVCLQIVDQGCGMDAETLKKIFDPFFTTKFTGRGLGLASVSGIARSHQGAVRAESELGKGSRFEFLMPMVQGDGEFRAMPQAPKASQTHLMTILAVDDEASIRRLIERILTKAGHRVLLAEDGVEAIELLREHHSDIALVLLDLTMPRKNGYETLLEIREHWPQTVVVLCSGYSEDEVMQKAHAEVQGFLKKPFTVEQLLQEIARVQP